MINVAGVARLTVYSKARTSSGLPGRIIRRKFPVELFRAAVTRVAFCPVPGLDDFTAGPIAAALAILSPLPGLANVYFVGLNSLKRRRCDAPPYGAKRAATTRKKTAPTRSPRRAAGHRFGLRTSTLPS